MDVYALEDIKKKKGIVQQHSYSTHEMQEEEEIPLQVIGY